MALRALHRSLGLLGLVAALAAPAYAAGDARALDDAGRVLTVGNWAFVTLDGGRQVRVADQRFLGWELRDQDGSLLAQGVVPGTDNLGVDGTPVLSRSPKSGDIWLAWSRQDSAGVPREIALLKFAEGAWAPGGPTALVADSDDQLEPSLIHDESGYGWMAWIDGVNSRTVKFLGLSPDGRVLGTDVLSDGVSERNGAPSLGIDAIGRLFVAFAGADPSTGDVSLHVLTPDPLRGGVSHVPDPIIELGLRASLPAPAIGQVEAPGSVFVPDGVHLTVLGGTSVAWWTESVGGIASRFRYAAEGLDGWSAATVHTIDLTSGMVATVPDALALVEARLRRVIEQNPGGSTTPVIPGTPTAPGRTLGRDVRR